MKPRVYAVRPLQLAVAKHYDVSIIEGPLTLAQVEAGCVGLVFCTPLMLSLLRSSIYEANESLWIERCMT